MNKWLVSVACAVAVMAMAWRWSLDDRPYDRLASYASLVESFRRIVFEADTGPRNKIWDLNKFADPIRARLLGDYEEWHRDHIAAQFALYERLTGLSFSIEDSNPNMEIMVGNNPNRIAEWAEGNNLRSSTRVLMLKNNCAGVMFGRFEGPLSETFITLKNDVSRSLFRRCAVEETVQALGLPADLATYEPSVFSNDPSSQKLSVNDKLLLRALYDDRIRPGMTRERAMPIAREVIRELHEAVQEHGEEALYQR